MRAPSTSTARPDVVMIGAGPTGLTAAVLLARAGCRVLVLDRDPGPVPRSAAAAWSGWRRPGVNQFRQVHIPLPCWHRTVQRELPELDAALRTLGGTEVNLLHRHQVDATGGWHDGDEDFGTLAARRPVLETAVAAVAAAEPGIEVRRGVRVTGLAIEPGRPGTPRVAGVRSGAEVITTGLVVDAAGTRTPVPGWLADLGLAPVTERSTTALSYYTRHYRGPGGPPGDTGALLRHHESYSVLTLPADGDTWGLALIVWSGDRAARALRAADRWEAAVRASGVHRGWLAGTPLTDVRPLAGLQEVIRDHAPHGVPRVSGVVPVGDAWATTSPFLGRGLSLGALGAVALRDAVCAGPEPEARYAALLTARVLPYVQGTIGFGRHRAAELAAEAQGFSYRTDDPAWAATRALAAGLRSDPVLLRAHARIAALLATPAEVFGDPTVRARLGPHFSARPYPDDHPGRPSFLAAIEGDRLETAAVGGRQDDAW